LGGVFEALPESDYDLMDKVQFGRDSKQNEIDQRIGDDEVNGAGEV